MHESKHSYGVPEGRLLVARWRQAQQLMRLNAYKGTVINDSSSWSESKLKRAFALNCT